MGHDGENEDCSRRDLAALIGVMGGAAGLAALAGCTSPEQGALQPSTARNSEPWSVGDGGVTGASFQWVDTIKGIGTTNPGKNLYGVTGSDESSGSRPVIVVGGYWMPGDGGGGVFYWSNTTITDDGGTQIVPLATGGDGGIGSVGKGWVRIYSGPINVRWFGAKGNGSSDAGVSDDAAAINAAIAVGAARQTVVYFPPGIYMVSSGINLTSSVELQGAGPQWTDAPGSCIRAMSAIPFVVQVAQGRVWIRNLWIDGNFIADNVIVLQYPASDCVYDSLLITRSLPLTSDVTKSNLVTVAAGSTLGIDTQTFRGCRLLQDPMGVGGMRGHACVSNYFPFEPGGNGNAFRWLFDDHCEFRGQQYGYRTKRGGATFAHSEFFDMAVALIAAELNQPILVNDCYTEPGTPQTTFPNILVQEETVVGPAGVTAGEITFTHCQFNTPQAGFQLNGKAPVRLDDCTITALVVVTPATAAIMPITVIGCGFPAGLGIQDNASYPWLNYFGNFTMGVGGQQGQLQHTRIGASAFDTNSSGAVIITDPATTANVGPFAVPEPDTNYRVIVGIANATSPGAARTPYAYNFTTSGFTIGLSGAMGAGQSCWVFWQLTR
jgi:hypothetical protein